MDADNRLLYRIAMSMLPGMTRARAVSALDVVGSEEEMFDMPECQLQRLLPGMSQAVKAQTRYQAMEAARREVEFVARHGVECIYFTDTGYPSRLEVCSTAPAMFYALGKCDLNAAHTVSVVGTRQCTAYGASFTDEFVGTLADRVDNLVVISGLAYGIDVCAHRAAMAHGVPTVAVVGHGMSTIYPAAHRDIASRMVRGNGMLLTDYGHDAKVHRSNFLARNRIVAALSDVVAVIESGRHGGALATAALAAKYGRQVFALPGRVTDEHSEGCNRLIASGTGRILTGAGDMIEAMGWETVGADKTPLREIVELSADEEQALRCVAANPDYDTEAVAASLAIPIGKAMAVMIGLEMKDLVTAASNGRYMINKTNCPSGVL